MKAAKSEQDEMGQKGLAERLWGWKPMLLVFVLGMAVAFVTSFPVALLAPTIKPQLQKASAGQLVLTRLDGTLWQSNWQLLVARKLPVQLQADLAFLPLLRGALDVGLQLKSDALSLQGQLAIDADNIYLRELRASLVAPELASLANTELSAANEVALRINEATVPRSTLWPSSLDANVYWPGGELRVADRTMMMPRINIKPQLQAASILLVPTSPDEPGDLAKLEIKDDRMMHVQVYQRGAKYVDKAVKGGPDKVVFEVQRPW